MHTEPLLEKCVWDQLLWGTIIMLPGAGLDRNMLEIHDEQDSFSAVCFVTPTFPFPVDLVYPENHLNLAE